MDKKYFKQIALLAGAVFLFAIIMLTISYAIINIGSGKYIYADIDKLPHVQAAVIPGAAILMSGNISPVLRDRVDMAIAVYRKGIAEKILVTGDNSSLDYNEVQPVKKYLLKNGIPQQDIFLDHAGFDTYSSMYRARDIFTIKSMVVVSQAFHLPRAVYIARRLGMEAYGIEADRGRYLFYNNIRELFGDTKALCNLLFGRKPRYLGEQIPITGSIEANE